jgi:hypothetical protein
MKAKALIEKLIGLIGTKDEALTKALENKALDEIELGDAIVTDFDSKMLTRQSAIADKEIVKTVGGKVRSETLDLLDSKMKRFLPLLDKEDVTDLEGSYQTWEKMDKLEAALIKKVNKLKTAGQGEDAAKLQEKITKLEEEYNAKILETEKTWKDKVAATEAASEAANLDFVLKSKIFTRTFAKEFENDKDNIAELKIEKLKKANILKRQQDGTIKIFEKDEDGTEREKFVNNKKVTVDDLIEAELASFTKKNNASNGSGGKSDTTERKTIEVKEASNGTLAQQRQQRNAIRVNAKQE